MGAGYTIEVSDCNFESMANISAQDITLEKEGGYCSANIKCDIKLNVTLSGGSYYDSIGNIENVALTVTDVKFDLNFGNGINSEILTDVAVEKYENQFDTDIEDLWKELIDVVEVEDIDLEYIMDSLSYGQYYTGNASLGGGWIGSTFTGEFTVEEIDSRSGYNDIESYTAFIPSEMVVDFIDKAKYGDNVQYTVYESDGVYDSYATEEEAITALKDYLDSIIAKGEADSIDFYDCYVERSYYYLVDGREDTYEYEDDYDNAEMVYAADGDPDYEEYV